MTNSSACEARIYNLPHSWAVPCSLASLILGLSLTLSSVASFARDGDDLLDAVSVGDLAQVRTLLDQGVEINLQSNEGYTALMLACWGGHEEIVKSLLDSGAEINLQSIKGYTALTIASNSGHEGNVQALLDNGAEINHQDNDGRTALMLASQKGHEGIVQDLLDNDATIDIQEKNGATALILASQDGHVGTVQLLLDNDAEINIQDDHGGTALMIASNSGHEGIVQALLAKGAEIDIQQESGYTALIRASQIGHAGIVQALLADGAEIDIQKENGYTALMLASQEGHEEIVQALLVKGADIDRQGTNGVTALILASQDGHQRIVQALLDNGAEINVPTKEKGSTALIAASQNGHEGTVKVLLNNGAEIDHQDKDGGTALMISSQNGHEGAVKVLLNNGAEIDHQGINGATALILASQYGHEGIVEALLTKGAKIDLQMDDGSTALRLAKTRKIKRILSAAARIPELPKTVTDPDVEIGAPFPADLRAQFVTECVGRADQRGDDLYYATSFCTCTFDVMRRGMTVDEYKEMESLQQAGKKPPEIPQLTRVWDDIQACKAHAVAITDKPLTRADTSEYSVPIPSGFFVPNTLGGLMSIEEVRDAGGLILVQRRRPALDNGFLASIVVLPIGTNDVNPADEALCRLIAELTLGTIESIRMVKGDNGPRCEAKKRDPEQATRGATFSFFASASGSWGVTCNYDTRDNQAIEACSEVLDGWRTK